MESTEAYPDEELEQDTYTLCEFNDKVQALLEEFEHHKNPSDLVRFILAGRDMQPDGSGRRACIDIHMDPSTKVSPEEIETSRDYDSFIGCSRNLPFRKAISVYPVPSFRDTLTSDNHMVCPDFDNMVSQFHLMQTLLYLFTLFPSLVYDC